MGNSCSPGCRSSDVYDGVFLCCLFFLRGVLDEILNFIESVSEGFPSYSFTSEVGGGNGGWSGGAMVLGKLQCRGVLQFG